MFGGSPCQDFSIAGKKNGSSWTCKDCGYEYNPIMVHYSRRNNCPQCGSSLIEKTRSSLLVEWLRILKEKMPRFAIYENVKGITSNKFKPTFDSFISELNEYGYNVYWAQINAMDQGIPQSRERVYCVIIRQDIDTGTFKFPNPRPLERTLYDMLDYGVDKRYYLNEDASIELINSMREGTNVSYCITQNYWKGINFKGYVERRRNQLVADTGIRKLTPVEAWRLFGFDDEDFNAARSALIQNVYEGRDRANTQLYKMAGNSIVVDVILHILENLYKEMPILFEDIQVGSFFSGIGAFEKALTKLDPNNLSDDTDNGDCNKDISLNQLGFICGYNGDANRIYDATVARTLKAEAGGGGAKTGWYYIGEE